MTAVAEQSILDFYRYPPIGSDDWRYVFETAQIRAIETQLLSRATLLDMANAQGFEGAVDLLGSSEYALPHGGRDFEGLEVNLRSSRSAVRELFSDLMIDKPIAELFRTRDDFSNIRLAVRRMLTKRPIGTDYSNEGNFAPELFEAVFEGEDYKLLPDYMEAAVERVVISYYQNKQIRQIDYAIDSFQAEYNLKKARELESIFLLGLFRIQIDLTNIRTMLRVKFTESEERDVFLEGGYLEPEQLRAGLNIGNEEVGQLFFATPYQQLVETSANYLVSNKSFLKTEQQCEEYITGFLKTTVPITSGPQPIIAYLLMKENEIRTVRLILTAKKNELDTRLILDRIGE